MKKLTPTHQNNRDLVLSQIAECTHNALSSIYDMPDFIFVTRNNKLRINRGDFTAHATISAVDKQDVNIMRVGYKNSYLGSQWL